MNGIKKNEVSIDESAVRDIIRFYTREAGVRGLERSIGKILRKVVRMVDLEADGSDKKRAAGKSGAIEVTAANLGEFLGVRKFTYGIAQQEPQVGQVNGLAWTEVGGDILTVETVVFPG